MAAPSGPDLTPRPVRSFSKSPAPAYPPRRPPRPGTARHRARGGAVDAEVLGAVGVRRADSQLGPFPPEVGDQVRAPGIAGDRVALPDGLLRLAPVLRGDRLGVVVDAPEIEAGAEA